MITQTPSALFARLRETTAELHRELEAKVDPARRFATRPDYVGYLREIEPLYAGFEAALAALPWGETGIDVEARRKTPLLARDLAYFGEVPSPKTSAAGIPGLATLAAGIGCLYVLEGATLGSQYILRELEKQGLTADTGAAFFAGYGERTGAMWNTFKEAAIRFCVDETHVLAAEDAAAATFAAYSRGVSPLSS